jgi:hypothetical protein
MLCAGIVAAVGGPAVSAVTSSHTCARKPARSITARISAGVRRKLVDGSFAHITG